MKNILSIDVEECFHSEYIPYGSHVHRTPSNIDRVLRLLNEFDVSATFFVVGEIGEKFPEVVEKIRENGYELAFHGYHHEPLWRSNAETLRSEIKKFNSLMKERCIGFRAPSFSLSNKTKWALKVLDEAGFIYDSSIFPTRTPLYGVWKAPIRPYKLSFEDVTKEDENGKLWEFPLLICSWMGLKIPMAGGFYLRFFSANIIKNAIKKANEHGSPAVMYVHNWELDSQTPKTKQGPYASFITYHNVGKRTEKKLRQILTSFQFTSFRNYIIEHELTQSIE